MRIVPFLLAVLAISCAPMPQQTVYVEQHPEHPPEICNVVTTAINRGDWVTLRSLVKSGMLANGAIKSWEDAWNTARQVHVGKLLMAQTFASAGSKPDVLYSFELHNKDGSVNPHWLQIKVEEKHGQPQIVDFWNFGW